MRLFLLLCDVIAVVKMKGFLNCFMCKVVSYVVLPSGLCDEVIF